ncbi:MAG: hypothetical protein EOM47_00425 [Bacteroidia bacterium]|nr:hypothetical protein [Bacteroidia bacterium]
MKTNFILKIAIVLSGLFQAGVVVAQSTENVLEIQSSQTVRLNANTVIDRLIVNADKESSGELIIESGVVQVKKMTYRMRLKPAEWTMISLPSDIANLNDTNATNIAKAGLIQNSGAKRYLVKRYDAQARAIGSEPWIQITTPEMKAGAAYLIYVVTGTTDMFDLEFYFDNVTLNSAKAVNNMFVDVDLTGKEVLKNYNVQINARNIKANTLNVAVYNEPENVVIPVNLAEALKDAAVIMTEENDGFRITLPDAQITKVIITDRKMKKVLKAVEYVAPAVIRLDGLKPGTYKAVIEYGSAMEVKTFRYAPGKRAK